MSVVFWGGTALSAVLFSLLLVGLVLPKNTNKDKENDYYIFA